MFTAAFRLPRADGSNRTVNVVLPPGATVASGWTVTVKSLACAPAMVTLGLPLRSNPVWPRFKIV